MHRAVPMRDRMQFHFNLALQFTCAFHCIRFNDSSSFICNLQACSSPSALHLMLLHFNHDGFIKRRTNCTSSAQCTQCWLPFSTLPNTHTILTKCALLGAQHTQQLGQSTPPSCSSVQLPPVLLADCSPLKHPAFSLTACRCCPRRRHCFHALFFLLAAPSHRQAARWLRLFLAACPHVGHGRQQPWKPPGGVWASDRVLSGEGWREAEPLSSETK